MKNFDIDIVEDFYCTIICTIIYKFLMTAITNELKLFEKNNLCQLKLNEFFFPILIYTICTCFINTKKLFQDLPQHCKNMVNDIFDDVVRNMYSKFEFLYLYFPLNFTERKSNSKYIFEYLKDSKFITYHISNILPNFNSSIISINQHENNNIEKTTSLIICIEEKCLIIEKINLPAIIEIIN